MKNQLIFLTLLFLCNLITYSQTEVDSKISNITVFKQNAQITRNKAFTSNGSEQEIVLTGISTRLNPSSLQIQFSNSKAVLLSAKYENNYLQPKKNNKQIDDLQKQLEVLNEELILLNDRKNGLLGMESILNKNQDLGTGNSSFTAQQVIQLSDSYQVKYLEIRTDLRELAKKEQPVKEKIEKIKRQLIEINANSGKPSGNIILKITSNSNTEIKAECKYIVNNSGWKPIYDLRSESITENVQLNYKANVYQNTGVDWTDVNMTVSTGNPSQNNNRPILSPLYASIYQQQRYQNVQMDEVSSSNMALTRNSESVEEIVVTENQLNIDFEIPTKQSINSDGKENLVFLKSYELTTEYIYHSVPKLNNGAFLLAKISDWSQFNLVAGNANIFFEGGFAGTSYINPQVTSNELLISMGRDNSIVVERLPIKEYKSSKLIGTNKKETIGYEITIKNKKSVPIQIEILDQIPVSQNKIIEVEVEEKGKAEYTSNIGKLLWTLDIEPRQTQNVKFIYSVKYPKDESVIGIK